MSIEQLIRLNYQVEINEIRQVRGGWSASAYVITDISGRKYMLKAYDKKRASTPGLTSMIENYMSVVELLNSKTSLNNRILKPVNTIDGKYKSENSDSIFLLSHYIEGYSLDGKVLSKEQVRQLADIVAELHRYGEDIAPDTIKLKEQFNVDFCSSLKAAITLKDNTDKDFSTIITKYDYILNKSMCSLVSLAESRKTETFDYRLCHTDIHGGNLIQGKDKLVLIDWENMKLAPVEADMFGLLNEPGFDMFFDKYKEIHPNYKIDKINIQYYSLKRRLEDIREFTEQLLFDNLSRKEKQRTLACLRKECEKLESDTLIC